MQNEFQPNLASHIFCVQTAGYADIGCALYDGPAVWENGHFKWVGEEAKGEFVYPKGGDWAQSYRQFFQ